MTTNKKPSTPKKPKIEKPKAEKPKKVEPKVETLTGEHIKVLVHKKPACLIELEVIVEPALILQTKEEAIKKVNKEVSLPGFRPGKAPKALVIQKYEKPIEEKTQKLLADKAFGLAQKLANIPLLNHQAAVTYNLKNFSYDKGATLIYAFETEPTVPTIDVKKCKLKKVKRAEVKDKQIDEAVRQVRFFHATWKDIQDRPVKEGDYVLLDIETIDKEPFEKVFSDTRFEVSKKGMAKWMQDLIIGAKLKEAKEGISKPDDTLSEKEKIEFAPKKVRVTIKKIEEAALPKIDDEFAKKTGAANVEEMKKSIGNILNTQADEAQDKEIKEQINQFLLTYDFALPNSLIDEERKFRLYQHMQDPRFKDSWEKMTPEQKKQTEDKILEDAKESIRLFYLSRKIVHDQKIEIDPKEIENLALSFLPPTAATQISSAKDLPRETYALAFSKLILAKAQDYVLEQSKKNA